MSPIKLHVFDFDGTLFRSPEKPVWWKGGWWGNLNSLSPPCVPDRPSSDWWNETVVQAAKQSINNPDVMAILLTGRIPKFSLRLKDLLRQAGLHFDQVHLSSGGPTESFKMKVIKEILDEHPAIRGVSIWEDRGAHLRLMSDWVESHGRACIPHLITVSAHESGCIPPVEEPSPSRVASRYKSKTKDEKGNVHYEYGPRQVQNRHSEKAKRVEKLRGDISDLRDKVRKDLASKDAETCLPALAVALIDETCERVGNDESAADGHYGVTGWMVKHLSFDDGEAIFKYVGKSGVKHEKVVTKAPVVKLLKELTKGRGKNERLLERDGFVVKPEVVNSYLKEFEITAKDIRGFRANQEMCRALREARREGPDLPRSRKERDEILKEEFKDALEEVAETVGHEPATLRSDYLVPGLEDAFMKDGTILSTFKSATKSDAENENEAVEDLIKPSPKKKPPRNDLKKRRVDLEEDDDLGEEDDDLSLNFKKVAVRVALVARIVSRFLRGKSEKKDTDFSDWAEAQGDTFIHEESHNKVKYDSLPEGQKAKIRDSWEKDQEKTDGKDEKPETEDAEEEEERVKSVKSELRDKAKTLEDAPAFDEDTGDHVGETLDAILDTMPEKDAKEFVESIVKTRDAGIDSLSKGKMPNKRPPDRAKVDRLKSKYDSLNSEVKGYQRDLDSGRISEEKAKKIQAKVDSLKKDRETARKELQDGFSEYYTHAALEKAVRNPMTFIRDTSTPLDKSTLKDRASESAERFKNMTAEDRSAAAGTFKKTMKATQQKVRDLEKSLSSEESADPETRKKDMAELETLKNRVEYLDADWRALEVTQVIQGDGGETRMAKNTQALIKALHTSDLDTDDIIESGIGIEEEPDPRVVSNLLSRIGDDQMEAALQELDPSGKLSGALKAVHEEGKRSKIENAHRVFADMFTDAILEDAETFKVAPDPKKAPKTKSKTKSKPSEIEETPSFEYKSTWKPEDLKLDADGIPVPSKTASARRIAARFAHTARLTGRGSRLVPYLGVQ